MTGSSQGSNRRRCCGLSLSQPGRANPTCPSPSRHAVKHGKVRYFTATELVETLYRDLADNTVGRVIARLLRPT